MNPKDVLSSWKEISSYLRRSRSTCQRWEAELGLPVRRVDGTPKARVFAYKAEIDRWMAEKQHLLNSQAEEDPALRRRKHRHLRTGVAAVVILAAIAVAGWRAFAVRTAPFPEVRPSLAVLEFENISGDRNLESWKVGLPYLVNIDLMQSRYLDVVPPKSIHGILGELGLLETKHNTAESLIAVANRAMVDYTVSGSLIRAGQSVLITCLVQEPQTGEVVKAVRHECAQEEDLFSAVDDLTKEIKRGLNLSARQMAADIDKKVARITTGSPEAWRLYCEGQRLTWLEKPLEALSCLERAVAADMNFALGYQCLFAAYMDLGQRDEAWRYLQRAFELSERTPEREQALIQGYYYEFVEKDLEKAARIYERTVSLYPMEASSRNHLGRIYNNLEDWNRAIQVLEKIVQENQQDRHISPELYTSLSAAYAATGAYDKAESLLDDLLKNLSTRIPSVHFRRVLLHIVQRQFEPATALASMTKALYPNYPETGRLVGYVHQLQGDFAAAAKEYESLLGSENPRTQFDSRIRLANLYLDQGKVGESISQLKLAVDFAQSLKEMEWERAARTGLAYRFRLFGDLRQAEKEAEAACRLQNRAGLEAEDEYPLRALIALELGHLKEFDDQAEMIRGWVKRVSNPRLMRIYYHLMGQRELQRNNMADAVDLLEKAQALLPCQIGCGAKDDQAKFFDSLGEAYYRGGDLPDAAVMYKKISLLTTGREAYGDIYARSFYRLGRIYEDQGEKRKAVENYKIFLGLWRNADPIFEEVTDAQERLQLILLADG
jgi:tetratricopeptide (TPR) repeat protein